MPAARPPNKIPARKTGPARRESARGQLSRQRITLAALAQIDAAGLEALTLRGLAQTLGCEAMSLYRHVRDKDDLLDGVVDRLIEDLPLPRLGSASPRRLMRIVADNYRELARRHPMAFPLLTSRRFNSAASLRMLEHLLGILKEAGLNARRRACAFRALGYFLNGLGMAEAAVLGPGARAPILVDRAPTSFPLTQASARWLGPDGLDATYEAGIEALLDRLLGPN